jgi:hypothetical protein
MRRSVAAEFGETMPTLPKKKGGHRRHREPPLRSAH